VSGLTSQLARQEREEVASGIRLLLAHPLITVRTRPEDFDLVRRRRQAIASWFEQHCGWRLQVEPRSGYARLDKVRAEPDPSRPARRLRTSRAPFDRRRYTLLCVVAAELLAGPVTTIGLLADRVVQATAADPVLTRFDTASRAERMAYVDALRLLEHHGVLHAVDGASESFVDHCDAKVLYRVDTTLLMRLLGAPVPPSRLAEPGAGGDFDRWLAALVHESRYGDAGERGRAATPGQRELWLRHSIVRRLVDDPVVYRGDLSPSQRRYLATPVGLEQVRQACAQAGFELEERAEGLMAIDPDAIATDARFPDDAGNAGNARIAALLLLDTLTAAPAGVSVEQLRLAAQRLLDRFPSWAKAYRSEGGSQRLAEDALAVLRAFGLVDVLPGGVDEASADSSGASGADVSGARGAGVRRGRAARRGATAGLRLVGATATGRDATASGGVVVARPAAARYRVHAEDRTARDGVARDGIAPDGVAGDGDPT
jgi:uncharacterized protein (TIGR02678 family)